MTQNAVNTDALKASAPTNRILFIVCASVTINIDPHRSQPIVQDCACLVPAYSFKSLYGTPRKLHAATKTTRKLANTDAAPRLRPLRSAPAVASKPLHSSGTARCRSTRCALVSTDNG